MLSCEQVSFFDCFDLGLMAMKPDAYGTTTWFLKVVQKFGVFLGGGGGYMEVIWISRLTCCKVTALGNIDDKSGLLISGNIYVMWLF